MARPSVVRTTTIDDQGDEVDQPGTAIGQVIPSGDESFGYGSDTPAVIKRHVAIPVLSLRFDPVNPRPLTFRAKIISAIEQGKALSEEMKKKLPASEQTKEPAYLCMIESITGEVRTLVVGETLRGDLVAVYPNDGYVGAWFQITKFPPAAGKRYSTYKVIEIEAPAFPARAV